QFGYWHPVAETCLFGPGMCGAGWEASPTPLDGLQMFTVNAVSATTRFPLPTLLDGILGEGTHTITARASATTRRYRVPCALPFAVSVCQLLDAGGFCDPGGTPKNLTFVSANNSDPWALLRIDIRGVNGESPPVLRDFVRNTT